MEVEVGNQPQKVVLWLHVCFDTYGDTETTTTKKKIKTDMVSYAFNLLIPSEG